ncbi:hypothetical protein PUN28_013446 [Cardiocondyla obscurior]|uniref:Outer dynein arm-docking complex subunit 4 n=1 Tax=Cardiocondyla obscurior TaxID=286306 RepID=A0AAW2F199_9HYME
MATSVTRKLNSALHDLDVTKKAVENAECRARLQIKTAASKRLPCGNDRQYAQALHRQADELCQRGEYESALVLFHRASVMCPRDSSHSVAAQRIAAMISSWNNSDKSSTRGNAISSHKNATFQPRKATPVNLSIIPNSLKYPDGCTKTSREMSSAPELLIDKLMRCRTLLERTLMLAFRAATLRNSRVNFNASDMKTCLELAEGLLTLSSGLKNSHRYKIPAYQYLALIHTILGRHDRACGNVAIMVRLSKGTNNVVFLSRALATLGRVHLSFGHLEAAARALENLSIYVNHPVPRAWVHHEIGRCHLETGKYDEGLRKAAQCRECAVEASSKKWTFHADLLRAQCLAMLGRFAEALEKLRIVAKISEEEGDTPMLSYIRDLIEQLNRAPREVTLGEDRCSGGILRRLSPRCEEPGLSEGDEAITSSRIRRTTCSKDNDTLTPLYYSDCLENRILDHREIESSSSLLDSVTSCRSKRTNFTYVIDSRTNVSYRNKFDETRISDDKLLSRESYATFQTCRKGSGRFINEDKMSDSLKRSTMNKCETFRISRSCEDGRRNFNTVISKMHRNVVGKSRGYSSLDKMEK